MNRRSFFHLLIASGIVPFIPKPKFAWNKINPLWNPHPKQIEFLNQTVPVSLYGIPYHCSNASSGQWLGFNRTEAMISKEAHQEIVKLIQILEKDKNDSQY